MAAGVTTDQCWRAPRRVSSSFPPRIQPGPPAWPPRLAGPGQADAGVAFVHGANEAKEGEPRRRGGGAPRAGSPLPFPHESSQAHPRGPPAWPTRLADAGVADAGVAFVHGAKEAMEGGPLAVAWWHAPLRVSSSFSPLHPAWPTPWPWPTRLADPKSGCERHEGEHVVVLGRGRGHNKRVKGPVRRRWEPESVDAREDAHEVGFVRPRSCPPSRTAIAAPFFVLSARKATHAIITIIRGRSRVFSPRASLFAPPRLSPWRPSRSGSGALPCPWPCPWPWP